MFIHSHHSIVYHNTSGSSTKVGEILMDNFNVDIDQIVLITDDMSNCVIVDCSMHDFLQEYDAHIALYSILTTTFKNMEKNNND